MLVDKRNVSRGYTARHALTRAHFQERAITATIAEAVSSSSAPNRHEFNCAMENCSFARRPTLAFLSFRRSTAVVDSALSYPSFVFSPYRLLLGPLVLSSDSPQLSGATGVVSCVGAFGSDAQMEKICGDATVTATEVAKKVSNGVGELPYCLLYTWPQNASLADCQFGLTVSLLYMLMSVFTKMTLPWSNVFRRTCSR